MEAICANVQETSIQEFSTAGPRYFQRSCILHADGIEMWENRTRLG